MSQLAIEALAYRYLSKKRDAEQIFDFFNGVLIADTNVDEVNKKLEEAVDNWVEADLKLGALAILCGDIDQPFSRVTENDQEEIFNN